jgi:hypothetical protein
VNALWLILLLAPASETPTSYILCKSGVSVRTIRIEESSKGCTVFYTKLGKDEIKGHSASTNTCKGIVENIRGNLSAASWVCRDISEKSAIVAQDEGVAPGAASDARVSIGQKPSSPSPAATNSRGMVGRQVKDGGLGSAKPLVPQQATPTIDPKVPKQ